MDGEDDFSIQGGYWTVTLVGSLRGYPPDYAALLNWPHPIHI